MTFSLVLHGTVPKDEICGVIVGHGRLTSPYVLSGASLMIGSMVLLQRCIPLFTQRAATSGSSALVAANIRGEADRYWSARDQQ